MTVGRCCVLVRAATVVHVACVLASLCSLADNTARCGGGNLRGNSSRSCKCHAAYVTHVPPPLTSPSANCCPIRWRHTHAEVV
jgi:hypothetical protein